MGVRWNTGLMQNLGIRVETRVGQLGRTDRDGHEWFPLREAGGLEFSVRDAALQKFVGGSLRLSGGYVLRLADGGTIDLRDATLRVNASNPLVLDVVSSDGKVWFFTDRIMFELVDNNRTLKVHTADLRVTPELARRMHAPESEGWGLGDFAMDTEVNISGSGAQPDRVCTTYPWPGVAVPGVPGATSGPGLGAWAIAWSRPAKSALPPVRSMLAARSARLTSAAVAPSAFSRSGSS